MFPDKKSQKNEEHGLVKSTAVVKYSATQSPATFAQLQCNTDLNLPPANWLSTSGNIYGLQHVLSHSTGFSSFRMAHMFPDCVGEVDVVSDAENIKNLLKLPYSHGQVSMMVHRIENTLLIDEFDIYKHLLRTAEKEWEWLRKFFFEHVRESFSTNDRSLYLKNKSRDALQEKSLVSKFLYHSLVEDVKQDGCSEPQNGTSENYAMSGPVLPDPNIEEEVPDPASDHKYNRNVVWTFEDIQMLIGTDMPIFGGTTHPCVSLRLRDMARPISVLTGIDYWLDNLMSNVPEVVMCYHLNGIVQKYELIKTEDLPNMENSKFSPKVIRYIAQNILSFLKSNSTKAGHTYWLFKSKDDDVVKLYDLTSLCSDEKNDKDQNPFTVPVAMLLYRVARNMKHMSDRKQPGTIRMLLKNCIELLPVEKYPQIVTSSHYMISDLYVPANTNPTAPGLQQMETDDIESCYDDDELNGDQDTDDSATKQLNLNKSNESVHFNTYKPPPPIAGSLEERCMQALTHVIAGLKCLQYFPSDEENEETRRKAEQSKKREEEENQTMAKPFEAIPMPYATLSTSEQSKSKPQKKKKKNKNAQKQTTQGSDSPNALLPKPNAEAVPTWREPDRSDNASWNAHLKTLLYEKASLVFAILAEHEYVEEKYGSCIKTIVMLMKCHQVLMSLKYSSHTIQESCLLGRAGDACFMMAQKWVNIDIFRKQMANIDDVQNSLLEEMEKEDVGQNNNTFQKWINVIPQEFRSKEQLLLSGQKCYETALQMKPVQDANALNRRLGNIQNELGVFYMNKAAENQESFEEYAKKSSDYFQSGIKLFKLVKDESNLALLLSNMGRLMRVYAHFSSASCDTAETVRNKERHYYQKAIDYYQRSLQVVGDRKQNPMIWETVCWELTSALFTRACILQDYPSADEDHEVAEKEVSELLNLTLRYCDPDTASTRQPIYQYRVAAIYHRLGSLYQTSYRRPDQDEQHKKRVLQLSKMNYERASRMFKYLEQPFENIKALLELVALLECTVKTSTNTPLRIKNLQYSLYLLTDALPSLNWVLREAKKYKMIKEKSQNSNNNEETEHNTEEEIPENFEPQAMTYTNTLLLQLQFVLRLLTKLSLTKSGQHFIQQQKQQILLKKQLQQQEQKQQQQEQQQQEQQQHQQPRQQQQSRQKQQKQQKQQQQKQQQQLEEQQQQPSDVNVSDFPEIYKKLYGLTLQVQPDNEWTVVLEQLLEILNGVCKSCKDILNLYNS